LAASVTGQHLAPLIRSVTATSYSVEVEIGQRSQRERRTSAAILQD
jgi:hypothetical protein